MGALGAQKAITNTILTHYYCTVIIIIITIYYYQLVRGWAFLFWWESRLRRCLVLSGLLDIFIGRLRRFCSVWGTVLFGLLSMLEDVLEMEGEWVVVEGGVGGRRVVEEDVEGYQLSYSVVIEWV